MKRKKSVLKSFDAKGPQREPLDGGWVLQPIGEAFLYRSPHERQSLTSRPANRAWDSRP